MKKGLSDEIIARIELFESTNIGDALEKRYFAELMSYRKLCALWNINGRTIKKIIAHCNKEPRYRGDAVKTQWINNAPRRIKAGDMLGKINHDKALKGLHIRQGKTKENSEMIRQIAEKLKTSSSLLRPEVRKKAVENARITRLKRPENNPFLKTPISKVELILIEFLNEKDIKFVFRYIVKGYFVNFYLPDYHLLIDLQGSNRFPLSFKRHQAIQEEGFSIVYCVHYFIKKSNFSDLYDYITTINKLGHNPPILSKKSVIWGASNLFPFGKQCNEVSVESIRVNKTNKLLIAATTN